jgi:hypothetical protein
MMDAYLSKEALQTLSAVKLVLSESNTDGILLGHKRGQRYMVESVFPSHGGFFSSSETFFALDKLFKGRIIGFYSFQTDEDKTKKILAPFAFGKLFLRITSDKNKQLIISPFSIEYQEDFYLSPITLA